MDCLNKDILIHLCSFLSFKELCKTDQVSKNFIKTHLIQEVWKNLVSKYLDNQEPYQECWKKRFKIIYNWMHGRAMIQAPCCQVEWQEGLYDFSLSRQSLFEIHEKKSEYFTVHNQFTKKRSSITNCSSEDTKTIGTHSGDQYWTKIDCLGGIYCYDLENHQLIGRMTFKAEKECFDPKDVVIHFDGKEVLVAYEENIYSANCDEAVFNQEKWKKTPLGQGPIHTLHKTLNYIVCGIEATHTNKLMAIHRHHPTKEYQAFSDPGFLLSANDNDQASSDSFFAILSKEGKVFLFKDTDKNFKFFYSFPFLSAPYKNRFERPSITLYHNWLLTYFENKITVWNIHTQEKLSEIRCDTNRKRIQFVTNGIHLFALNLLESTSLLYDFSRPPPLKKRHEKGCLIM